MAGNREYSPDRFEQLVLYVSWQTRDDEHFGRTKLAKVLFYSDLCAYAETGQSLTGATYRHYPFGPFPPALYEVEEKLHAEGRAVVSRLLSDEPMGEELKIVPHAEPVPIVDAYLVDSYIRKVSEAPTWKVSDDSHDHPGWLLTQDYEEIPYHVALMSRRRPTPSDLERVEELAAEHNWP